MGDKNIVTINECQQEIIRLKKEKDICIFAHSYQAREIIEVAGFIEDSYEKALLCIDRMIELK